MVVPNPPAADCSSGLAGHFVSPNGLSTNDGTFNRPWDLQTALNHPSSVRPGQTIWMRGGTYRGLYRSNLAGTAAAPIVVRPCGSEAVSLDAGGVPNTQNHSNLTVSGPHTWFRDFEITNSDTNRIFLDSHNTCFDRQQCRPAGIDVFGAGVKIINLVVHDVGVGIGSWSPAADAEIYGNIIYNVGWQSQIRGSGHGLYAQNATGTRRLTDNIVFNNFHSGAHVYGTSESSLRNVRLEGNVIFNNGLLAQDPNGWGVIVGGNVLAEDIALISNYFFIPFTYRRGSNINPSWGNIGTTRLTMVDNYSVGYKAVDHSVLPTATTITGNSFFGDVVSLGDPQTNNVGTRPPSQPRYFLRRNFYEPNRTTVVVFNGGATNSVSVDLSTVLSPGDRYEIRDVQNYLGAPILSGSYSGALINLPMNGTAVARPIGTVPNQPLHTDATFGTFVVKRLP